MKAAAIALVLAALVAGCAKQRWVHPTKSSETDLKHDLETCAADSGMSSARGAEELAAAVQTQDLCLERKGWRKAK